MSRPPRTTLAALGVLGCLSALAAAVLWSSTAFPSKAHAAPAAPPGAASAVGGSWLHWRGPEQNGVSREKDLPETFSPDPAKPNNNLIWKAPYGCRSTPVIQNGRVYIINNAGEGPTDQERMMCLDAKTGALLWEHKFNVFFTDIVASRICWTNPAGDAETGNVYIHGTQGFLHCYNPDGKLLWSHSLTEEYGRVSGYGGRLASPIVDGDLVIIGIVNASWGDLARGSSRFAAFNKKTGEPVWWADTVGPLGGTYYSTPVVAVINGERLLISGAADGAVYAYRVRTGEKVWGYRFGGQMINASVVVQDGRVYACNGEENLDGAPRGRIICLDANKVKDGKPELVWEVPGIVCGYTTPILHGNDLYVCDDGAKLFLFDALKGGEPKWKFALGRAARGSGVWADGKIYIGDVDAHFHILQPTPEKCKELHNQLFRPTDGLGFVEINGTPAVVDGRVYFGTRDAFYCIGKKNHEAKADPIPPEPAEKPVAAGAKPAYIQVVPADVAVHPGDSVTFKARAFDDAGHFLKEVEGAWSLPAPPPPPNAKTSPPPLKGEITPAGKLTVAKEPPGQQGYVEVQVGGVTGRARVRVAPVLPYRNDFSKVPVGATPGGWVNTPGKYAIVELADKSHALKKLANSSKPPLARANAYITLPDAKDYTIAVDALGESVNKNMPDLGLVNSRYTLMLDGNKQQLRILSWEALPRVDHTIPFAWKPDEWYRLKFTVTADSGKAVVRGKVWPRSEEEPKEWTIETTDATPNLEGAPAIYAYSTGIAEPKDGAGSLFQNLIVVPNTPAK
jgi:outer membrane protein assembly factor BamB